MTIPAADTPSWLDDFLARCAAFEAACRDDQRARASEPDHDANDLEEPLP